MLLRALVVVALVSVLAATLLHACATLARARVHRIALAAAERTFALDLATIQRSLTTAIRDGADPRAVPIAPSPLPPACALTHDSGCSLWASSRIAATTAVPIGEGVETTAPCRPRCADNLQGNDAVAEGRIGVAIDATVAGASGEVFARRRRFALFRTLRVPPYAALIGTRDATDESIARGGSTGDDAGLPATVVDVRYVDATTGATIDANAWQSRGWNDGGASAAGWDP
ncbi:MAG TPA: hypothetical protein VIJ12_00050 [Candidatus Baltobacteraceae bacterium]